MKITYTKNRLRDALDSAPPMMAATAVKQAEALLGEMQQECVARLDVLLATFPAGLSGDDDARRVQVREVYETSRRMIGVATVAGIPEMDIAAQSLSWSGRNQIGSHCASTSARCTCCVAQTFPKLPRGSCSLRLKVCARRLLPWRQRYRRRPPSCIPLSASAVE
jgi:hypothetical protein